MWGDKVLLAATVTVTGNPAVALPGRGWVPLTVIEIVLVAATSTPPTATANMNACASESHSQGDETRIVLVLV